MISRCCHLLILRPLDYPPLREADAGGEFLPWVGVDAEGVVAAPGGPLMRAGGDTEKFGNRVGVAGRGGERDKPGIGR